MFGGVLGWLGGGRRGGGSGTGKAAAKPASANAGEAPAQPQQYHTGAVEQPDAPEGGVPEPTGSPFRKLTSAEEVRRSPRQAAAAAAHQPRRGKGVRVKKELPLGQLRSYAESIALKGAPLLPLGFPTGPWETREAVKAEIAAFCRNPSTGGGSHGVVWKQLSPGNDIHGPQCALACHKHVDGCSWRIKFEQTLEGWTPYSTFGDHSAHTLAQSVEEANVHKAMRDIPSELVQHAKNMADSGIPVCAIDRFLRHQVMLVGDAPTWTYQDVYHLVGASTRQRAMDATGFCEQHDLSHELAPPPMSSGSDRAIVVTAPLPPHFAPRHSGSGSYLEGTVRGIEGGVALRTPPHALCSANSLSWRRPQAGQPALEEEENAQQTSSPST